MDQTLLIVIVAAAVVGIVAVAAILARLGRSAAADARQHQFAASTEGSKRCPKCGMGNLWTDRTCIACKAKLPD